MGATSRPSNLRCPTTRPSSSMCRPVPTSAGVAIETPADRLRADGRDGIAPSSCRGERSAQACSAGSSTSSRKAEPDRHRDVNPGLAHARRKRRQRGTAHHFLNRRVEIWIARALSDGEVEDAAAAVDCETQYHTTLFTPLPGGIGVALVTFEPSAQQSTVARTNLGRWDRRRYWRWCVGGLRRSDRSLCGLRRRRSRVWCGLLQVVADRLPRRLENGLGRCRWRGFDHPCRGLRRRRRRFDRRDRLVRRRWHRLRLGWRGFGLRRRYLGLYRRLRFFGLG